VSRLFSSKRGARSAAGKERGASSKEKATVDLQGLDIDFLRFLGENGTIDIVAASPDASADHPGTGAESDDSRSRRPGTSHRGKSAPGQGMFQFVGEGRGHGGIVGGLPLLLVLAVALAIGTTIAATRLPSLNQALNATLAELGLFLDGDLIPLLGGGEDSAPNE